MTEAQKVDELKIYGSGIYDKIRAFFTNRVTVYVIRRFIVMIPMFLGISILTFIMVRSTGSPEDLIIGTGQNIEETRKIIRRQYGLDEPYYKQYLIWLENFVTWRFGYSGLFSSESPAKFINELIYQTAKLQYLALFLSIIISIPLGVKAARNRGKATDTFVSAIALFGLSMPIYVSGFVLIVIFGGGGLDLFPVKGAYSPFRREFRKEVFVGMSALQWMIVLTLIFIVYYLLAQLILRTIKTSNENRKSYRYVFITVYTIIVFLNLARDKMDLFFSNIIDTAWHIFLPTIALTFVQLALITRLVRSNMLEVLGQDYILAARANGLDENTIIWKHGLRNAIIPVITFIGLSIGFALAGAPITETVFTWPGLGIYYVRAIFIIDMSLILGITMLITVLILLSNLVTDVVYAIIDPRITI